jgi:hypothetical protein
MGYARFTKMIQVQVEPDNAAKVRALADKLGISAAAVIRDELFLESQLNAAIRRHDVTEQEIARAAKVVKSSKRHRQASAAA